MRGWEQQYYQSCPMYKQFCIYHVYLSILSSDEPAPPGPCPAQHAGGVHGEGGV